MLGTARADPDKLLHVIANAAATRTRVKNFLAARASGKLPRRTFGARSRIQGPALLLWSWATRSACRYVAGLGAAQPAGMGAEWAFGP